MSVIDGAHYLSVVSERVNDISHLSFMLSLLCVTTNEATGDLSLSGIYKCQRGTSLRPNQIKMWCNQHAGTILLACDKETIKHEMISQILPGSSHDCMSSVIGSVPGSS